MSAGMSIKDVHAAMVDATVDLDDFVDNGLAVHIVQQPHISEPTGTVCVHVTAKFLGRDLDVDDGRFQFHGMPLGDDPAETFGALLARVIRQHNGIEPG